MRFLPAGLFLAVALAGPAMLSAKDPLPVTPLEPSSAWRLDYGEAECGAVREFGTAAETASIQFNRDGPLSHFSLAIMLPSVPRDVIRRKTSLRADGEADWTVQEPVLSTLADGRALLVYPSLPFNFWERLIERFKTNQPVVFRLRLPDREIAFNMQKMKAIKEAFTQCEEDLMTSMGYEGLSLRNLRRAPVPRNSPLTWLTSDDFPPSMLLQSYSGAVAYWLDIDETGKVTGCRVIESIGGEAFRKVTCDKLMERAAFEPAVSASGAPIRAYMKQHVYWISPGGTFRLRDRKN